MFIKIVKISSITLSFRKKYIVFVHIKVAVCILLLEVFFNNVRVKSLCLCLNNSVIYRNLQIICNSEMEKYYNM